jgi:hypothetical protein
VLKLAGNVNGLLYEDIRGTNDFVTVYQNIYLNLIWFGKSLTTIGNEQQAIGPYSLCAWSSYWIGISQEMQENKRTIPSTA